MKSRLIAALIHFTGSVVIISLFLSVVYFIWYPRPFNIIHSVFDAVKVALIVDLVLGPFLTFVIFNTVKPRAELVRDISIIIIFQLVALGWGINVTHKMRPDFLVYYDGVFYSILKEDIKVENLNDNVLPPTIWQQPKSIYIEPLRSQKAIDQLSRVLKGDGIVGEMYKPEKYKPLNMDENSDYMRDILKHATTYEYLLGSKTWKDKVKAFMKNQGGASQNYLFYSIENATDFSGIIIFNKNDFSVAGVID